MQLSPHTRAAFLLICVVALAGCTTLLGESAEEEFLDKLEAAEPPDQLSATVENSFGAGDDEIETKQQLWVRDSGESRFESADGDDWLMVDDGEQVWDYFPDENRVIESESAVTETYLNTVYELSEEFVAELDIQSVEETTFDGNDAYHVSLAPPTNETESVDESILDVIRQPLSPGAGADDIEDAETATTDDSDENTSTEWEADFADVDSVELYFETESLFLVKTVVTGEEEHSETAYRNVSFESIPDDTFEFEPPSDAVREEPETPERTEFDSLSAAREQTDLPLSEPAEVPDDFERDGITVTEWDERDETQLGIRYQDDESEFMSLVMTDDEIDFVDEEAAEPLQVDGSSGLYEFDERFAFQTLEWECGEYELALTAPELVDREELVTIAESTGCS